jgi:NitT/TauT family transport system substrate-binding protein
MKLNHVLAAGILAGTASSTAFAQETTIKIGAVRSVANVSVYTGMELGWYKAYGINVEVDDLDASANAISLLATNRLQVVEGGISAGFFNGIEQKLPIIIASDRTSSPLSHKLIVRQDLQGKVKQVSDLKGLRIASNANASVTSYEVAKILETGGLNLGHIDLKIIAFPLMGAAFKNGAIDAALVIQPWASQIHEEKIGFVFADPDDHANPRPLTIAATIINTDWAKANPELTKRFFVAYMRGVRDFCLAYHRGPNRQEVVDRAARMGPIKDRGFIEKYPWPGRNMTGEMNVPSLLDIQKYYRQIGVTKAEFTAEQLIDRQYIDHANRELGPLPAVNPESKLAGCR